MELFTDLFASISPTTVILGVAVGLIGYWLFTKDKRNLPPSPKFCLPIIGHLHHMEPDMRKPCRKFREELGDVYTLQMGSYPAVFIGGYKTVHEAFVKNADVFSDRPTAYTVDVITRKRGFVNENGSQWKEHRRFVLSTLKDLGMGRRVLETKVLREANRLVQEIRKTEQTPFIVRPLANVIVSNVITSLLFGETFETDDPIIRGILDTIESNINDIPRAGILNFLPFLRWLPGDLFRLKRMIRNADKLHEFCDIIIKRHQENSDGANVDSLTSAYLKALKEKDEDTTFSVDNLGGTIADMIIVGSESSTTTLNWSIVCMVNFPDMQQKLYQVVKDNIGVDAIPSMADRNKLTYVEAFYMEVLRYCDITPLVPMHTVTKDAQLLGYTIPKDTLLFVDMDSMAMDPHIWGDPENFRPERFLDDDGKIVAREEYAIFFLGKRSCIGESLARMELFLILITLVQNFEFTSPENEQLTVESVDGMFGLAHGPKPYKVVAKPRK